MLDYYTVGTHQLCPSDSLPGMRSQFALLSFLALAALVGLIRLNSEANETTLVWLDVVCGGILVIVFFLLFYLAGKAHVRVQNNQQNCLINIWFNSFISRISTSPPLAGVGEGYKHAAAKGETLEDPLMNVATNVGVK